LGHGEGHLLAFLEALEALHLDGTEVDEHVLADLTADEAKALGVVEPFDGPGLALCHYCYSWNLAGWWLRRCHGGWLQGVREVERCSRPSPEDLPHHGDLAKRSGPRLTAGPRRMHSSPGHPDS